MRIINDTKKIRDESWDFKKDNIKNYTQIFHIYPAMMIPKVAGRIIDEFGKGAKLLFDPYCGTGTSLVEANLRGIDAIGTDINPLARLIAKVKTTIIQIDLIDKYIEKLNNLIFLIKFGRIKIEPKIPRFYNIEYWFKKDTIYNLGILKDFIEKIEDNNIQDFFKVCFSETIREVSLTKNSEFKLLRIKEDKIHKFNPDVFEIMIKKLIKNRKGMSEYIELKRNDSSSKIFDFNTVYEIPKEIIKEGEVDIIVTSPPYGDSRTTVAYGQFSKLSNQWLEFESFNEVDKKSMGGERKKEFKKFYLKILDETIEKISEKDINRAYDVISFYLDYEKSINNISKVVKKGGTVAFVVGNRKVKGITIPNDEITKEFFERNGFTHLITIVREIPNKRMPKVNSPSNIQGITDSTMNYEYIVVLKKI